VGVGVRGICDGVGLEVGRVGGGAVCVRLGSCPGMLASPCRHRYEFAPKASSYAARMGTACSADSSVEGRRSRLLP
jgi:hypothetical protein